MEDIISIMPLTSWARWELLSVILRQASTNFTDMFILKMDMYGEKRVGNHFRLIRGYWSTMISEYIFIPDLLLRFRLLLLEDVI